MTQALNFTIAALADLARMRDTPAVGPYDREGIDFISDLLRRAEVFVLPERGELLDRSKPRPQVPGAMFHPPFPVVALEYLSANNADHRSDPVFEATPCSKRIALAWEYDGRMPGGFRDPRGPSSKEGVCIASLAYVDQMRTWIPFAGAALIPFDCRYEDRPDQPALVSALVRTGRINAKQAAAPKIEIGGVLPLMPNWLSKLVNEHGMQMAMSLLSADLMDELNAYIDLCLALACNNVASTKVSQPHRLNRARIKQGKLALPDFHVLTIGGEAYTGASNEGQRDGVRSHLRRGHIRRLSEQRVTWVNATIVNGNRTGFVDKIYNAKSRVA